jgi:hypothetical protein
VSALTRFFFRYPASCRTPVEIVTWWEARRIPFNLAVGSAGLITLTAAHLITRLPPHPNPMPVVPSLVAAGIYGILANVCYTAGWMGELLVRRGAGDELEPVGPALFRYGFVFSIGLTLFPIAIAGLDLAFRIVRTLF